MKIIMLPQKNWQDINCNEKYQKCDNNVSGWLKLIISKSTDLFGFISQEKEPSYAQRERTPNYHRKQHFC